MNYRNIKIISKMTVQCLNAPDTFFLSDVTIEDTPKVQAIFPFFSVYLTSRASDTLKVQIDYLTFGNLITTSDTPKVQPSEAIAVEEYLLKLWDSIDGFLSSPI